MNSKKCAYRGQIFYFKDKSTFETIPISKEVGKGFQIHSYCYIEDGLLLVDEEGKISAVGQYSDMKKNIEGIKITNYKDKLITPGFIDTHIKAKDAIIASCPTSNNFLGSGLFKFGKTSQYTQHITYATDWGASNTLSMLRVMDDAYKVAMLTGYKLPTMLRWYLCTLGAARALQLNDKIGNFEQGKEADFIVIDPNATPLLRYRNHQVDSIFELLFIIMSLADERNLAATYIMGHCAYTNRSINS